ncbi:MAG TPA: hypothetical protein VHP54_02115 [Caproiciproducens sp.]|nr:hypothetical protein [Caproiciproducens sp.]
MAREQYLLHGDEGTIHSAPVDAKPQTPKSKWENFWYYHKWHVVAGVFILFVVLFTVYDFRSKENPDYEIGLITQVSYPSDVTDALEAQFAKSGTDLNGDGKVTVRVNLYMVGNGETSSGMSDPNTQMAGYVKITADLSNGTSMIFVTDDASLAKEQGQIHIFSYLDGSTPAEGAKDYDRMRVPLKDCRGLSNLKIIGTDGKTQDIYNDLSISMRVFKGTQMEQQKDKAAYYAASRKLFDEITKTKN